MSENIRTPGRTTEGEGRARRIEFARKTLESLRGLSDDQLRRSLLEPMHVRARLDELDRQSRVDAPTADAPGEARQ